MTWAVAYTAVSTVLIGTAATESNGAALRSMWKDELDMLQRVPQKILLLEGLSTARLASPSEDMPTFKFVAK